VPGVDCLRRREQREVREVFHPRVHARARHCVRVQLLGDVSHNRVESQRGWCDAGKRHDVLRHHDVGLTEDRIAECDVNSEGLTVHLSGEPAVGAEPEPVIRHPLVLDLGEVVVGANLKGHEFAAGLCCRAEALLERLLEGLG